MAYTALDRFVKYFVLDPSSGCWNWTGAKNTRGYGQFHDGDRMVSAYRWSYETFIGDIPKGLEMHHECRNRACVNPNHIKPLTHQENCLKDFKKTHCPKGHEFLSGSYYTITTKAGTESKICKQCAIERSKKFYADNREEQNAKNKARYWANRESNLTRNREYYHGKKAARATQDEQP